MLFCELKCLYWYVSFPQIDLQLKYDINANQNKKQSFVETGNLFLNMYLYIYIYMKLHYFLMDKNVGRIVLSNFKV